MAEQRRDPARERFWRDAISDWRASGLSVRAFCRQRQVTEAVFYAWRRELQRRDAEPATAAAPTFVPITVVATATVEVRCPSGHVVSLPNVELDTLRHLFAALTPEAPC